MIHSTRPILLHVLQARCNATARTTAPIPGQVPETALALSEACVRSARHTYRLLIHSWINGFFPTFDYTYTQHLFSAAVVLAISNLVNSSVNSSESDGDDFDAAVEILSQLVQNGNYAAKEFMRHIAALKAILVTLVNRQCHSFGQRHVQPLHPAVEPSHMHGGYPETARASVSQPNSDRLTTEQTIATGRLALDEPFMQELLSQDLDLRFLDPSMLDADFQTFFWPESVSGD